MSNRDNVSVFDVNDAHSVAPAPDVTELNLSITDREVVAQACAALSAYVSLNVYRELQKMSAPVRVADSGCAIIGNCSCSTK